MSEKLCCNCLHCARWQTSKGIECHCDLDDRYLGFITVMSETECERWEHETKWELDEKHDAEVRAEVIEKVKSYVSKKADEMNMRTEIAEEKADMMSANYFSGAMWHLMEVKEFLEQLKEQKNEKK